MIAIFKPMGYLIVHSTFYIVHGINQMATVDN